MKRKTGLVCLLVNLALLSACAAPQQTVWETVDDVLLTDCAGWQAEAQQISFDLPEGAVAQSVSSDGVKRVYAGADGAYEIISAVLLETSARSAVRRLTGFAPERVALVKTSREDGLSEYRFAWSAGSGEDCTRYRAALLFDEPYCYALLFGSSEQCGTDYDSTADRVIASMALTDGDGI